MVKVKGKRSFQQHVFDEIEKQAGKNNMLVIPEAILNYTADLPAAVFLSQLIYWCDKGKSTDGYIFKTYHEWKRETLLSEYQIKKAVKNLEDLRILQTKKKKANGAPTIYYNLDQKAFIDAILNFLRIQNENAGNRTPKSFQSLTEPTSEPSSEPTSKKDKGAKSDDIRSTPLSFLSYRNRYRVSSDCSKAIEYFLKKYELLMREEHPPLKPKQWASVVVTMSEGSWSAETDRSVAEDLSSEDLTTMINAYFEKDYQDGCDYRLMHFTSSGVFTNLYYETLY